jgi:hypothetical protein
VNGLSSHFYDRFINRFQRTQEKTMANTNRAKLEKREKSRRRRLRHLDNFFDAAFVLPSENVAEFKALNKTLKKEMSGSSVIDRYNVNRIAQSVWHSQRTWRLQAGSIAGARSEALLRLLEPKFGELERGDNVTRIVIDYFTGEIAQVSKAVGVVQAFGITPEQIEAYAVELQAKSLLVLEKMRARSDAAIQSSVKRLKSPAKSKREKPTKTSKDRLLQAVELAQTKNSDRKLN